MDNMGSNFHSSTRVKSWWVPRLDNECDFIRQQKRIAWIEGFIIGVMAGGALFYGLIQMWR